MNPCWKRRLHDFWRNWILLILVMLAITSSFRSAVADWNDVPSASMRPTILEGERIFVNRLAYDLKLPHSKIRLARWADPERGDIVICRSPDDGTRLVKRVVGVAGDRVELRGGRLVLNGAPVDYENAAAAPGMRGFDEVLPGRSHRVQFQSGPGRARDLPVFRVPEGKVFVMGDNRDNSADSRYFGFVDRRDVMGEVKAVVASVDPERWYRPRWDRWFTRLD